MARFFLLFVLFFVIARTFWRFIDGVVNGASTAAGARAGRRGGMQSGVKMQPCPVCGTYVVPAKAISQAGGTGAVYFCSEKCRAEYAPR